MIAADGWIPDIVVGIDFGMTCTGVAYSMGPEWAEPKPIQHWPGKSISELANKVPTRLQYNKNAAIVEKWGFLCDMESDQADTDVISCFKLHLDPTHVDTRPGAPSVEYTRLWFRDYMRCIHDHIEEVFSSWFPYWSNQTVEFVFSVPTTWKNPSMIAEIEKLIHAAGFGRGKPNQRARIGLTEAEAAAVYASKQRFEQNDVILVCDAGGGTTDVNVLRLASTKGGPVRLQQLGWVEGLPIGSAMIDMEFHQIISDRLDHIRDHLHGDLDIIADRMMHGRFERHKCAYNRTASTTTMPTIPLPIPGLSPGYHNVEAQIEDSVLVFTREEMKNLFDTQIDRMLALIDTQYERMQRKHPGVQISYIVLSGGLGSSPYVRQQLKNHFEFGAGSLRSNAQDTKILFAVEPQLAVVQGLVMDRIQAVGSQVETFQERCCRLSYGVRCREVHNPEDLRHLGRRVIIDPRDKKKYVENQIDWFIKQGDPVPIEGVSKPFWLKLKEGDVNKPWRTSIVTSIAPMEQLPTNLDQDGARILCHVESSNLKDKGVEMKTKNKYWFNAREKYIRARFDVRVIVGSADLKFQLYSKDQILSRNHDAIQVSWDVPLPTEKKEGADLTAWSRERW